MSCVIEVADSSLEYDRTTKLAIYARSGSRQYAIVNLVQRQMEIFEGPIPAEGRYERSTIRHAGDTACLLLPARMLEVEVKDLLP